jgi:NAD(P)-dependent dehydrogenase (short-subunit alcohol dehydrogenase family)
MNTVLITGANRGIGNALVEEFINHQWRVIACCRQPNEKDFAHLDSTTNLTLHSLDVTDESQIQRLAKNCKTEKIDILLHVAGLYGPNGIRFGETPVEPWLEVLKVNTIAPLKITEALIEQVTRSQHKTIVVISSEMGSISCNEWGNAYLYRSSKAALNAVVKSLSIDLKDQGVRALAIHPGWVKTDMGGPEATMPVTDSAHYIYQLLTQKTPLKSGGFFDYRGKQLPW